MLEVHALSFAYPEQPVFDNIEFSLAKGQLLYLRGNNGTGKTTLLRLLAGLLCPDAGLIQYDGQNIRHELNDPHKICYVGHKPGFSSLLSVRENCLYDLQNAGQKENLDQYLAYFALQAFADKPCMQLSVGQRRRVALLRLLMTSAKLWLLDEPLIALDEQMINLLMSILETHLKKGGLIVLTSHQQLPFCAFPVQEYCLL